MDCVIRIDRETGEKELVTLDYAIEKLSLYWQENKIYDMLISGTILFTPYATYQINK